MQAAPPTLESLRSRHEELTLRAEVQSLERIVRGEELAARLVESEWGDVVDRREFLHDTPGWGLGYDHRITSRDDRARGKCTPFFENETDLANIRGIGRFLAGCDPVCIGVVENLVSYTLGSGFKYKATARRESEQVDGQAGSSVPSEMVARVNRCLEQIIQGSNWAGGKETEAFVRCVRDGEVIVWIADEGGPVIRIVEPDYMKEPGRVHDIETHLGSGQYDLSFGIATLAPWHDRPYAYFFEPQFGQWEMPPAGEVVHAKVNVDGNVKRGISDFYAVYQTLERAAKLLGNTLQGAAVQATIAYIKEHVAGTTSDSITTARNTRATHTRQETTQAGGVRTIYGEKFAPGRVVETAGTKYHAGPLGQPSHPLYIQVIQEALRIAGVRWAMPEYMVSGDASNSNYSSTLVSGGPFDRATQRRQEFCKRHFGDVMWKALTVHVRRGEFLKWGIGTLTQLREAIQLDIEAPTVAIQDKGQEEEIRDKQQAAGVLSKKTRSAQSNLDYEVEQANIGQEPKPVPIVPTVAAALESVRTTEEAKAILEALYP